MPARRFRPTVALLLAVAALSGCGRAPEPREVWGKAGFVAHLSARTEACLSIRGAAAWGPSVTATWWPLVSGPARGDTWLRRPEGRLLEAFLQAPDTGALAAAVLASGGEEVCVAFGPGTAEQLASLQQVKRLFEAARIRNLFTPAPAADLFPPGADTPGDDWPEDLAVAAFSEVIVPLPPVMQEALENFVRHAAIPPVLAAFRSGDGENIPLAAFLEAWAAGLPDNIPRDRVEFPGHGAFTRVRLPVMSVVPREVAVRARDILAANIGDPSTATDLIRTLMAKTTTLCFGRTRGYFVISVGTGDPLRGLARDFADSLPAGGGLDRLTPLLGPDHAALLYADPLIVSLAAAPPPVGEYLDAALESALEFAPAGQIRALREAAAPLREEAAELFHPRVAALAGLLATGEDGWKAEVFGGSFAPRLATDNAVPLLAADGQVALLWTEHWEKGYAARLSVFAARAAAFADLWLEVLGPVFLDDADHDRAGRILGQLAGATAAFRHGAAPLLERAFDRGVALVVGLDGVMPPPPFAPAGEAVLPRVAVAADLRDPRALADLRQRLTADPAMARAEPSGTTAGGSATFTYPLPLAGPDLSPSVSVGHGRWVAGSAPSFTAAVTTWPRAPREHASVQAIAATTAPFAALASAWAGAFAEETNLPCPPTDLIPADPATLRAVAALLQTPRRLVYETRWHQGTLHRVIRLQDVP
jgi:hypothetical protein